MNYVVVVQFEINIPPAAKEAAEKVVAPAKYIPQALKRGHILNDLRHEWNSCPSRSCATFEFFRNF
jgi:hypothetical protein